MSEPEKRASSRARVIWLWAHPRSRSTAIVRMMIERGDVTVVHEPLVTLVDTGEVPVPDGAGGTVVLRSVPAVLAQVRELAAARPVFVKDTLEHRYQYLFAHPGEVAWAEHTFIVRDPRDTISSHAAMKPHASCSDIGYENQYDLFELARSLSGRTPVVIDADRLVREPGPVVAAYCAAVGLSYRPDALHWAAEDRPEWHRTREWHAGASVSTGFERVRTDYPVTVDNDPRLRGFYDHHRPFYDRMVCHAL